MSSPNPDDLFSVLVGFDVLEDAGLLPKLSERSSSKAAAVAETLAPEAEEELGALAEPGAPNASSNMLPMEPLLLVDPAAAEPNPPEGDFFIPVVPIPMPRSANGSLLIFPEDDRL